MSSQFGRQWRLEIGNQRDGLAINALRVAFEIQKTIDDKPNPAKIRIWNLNRDNMNKLLDGTYNKATLSVGYDQLRLLFVGDIIKSRVRRDGLDWVMELQCGDGDAAYFGSRVSLSLRAGATDAEIVAQLAQSMDGVLPGTIDIPNARRLPRGKVITGNTKDALSRVTRNSNAEWSIQDGELMILPADKFVPGEAVVLSEGTGMIGAPEATDNGLEISCLLNPALRIGGLVRVHSMLDYFNGDYKAIKIDHNGDGLSGDWLSRLVLIGGKFEAVEKNG